MNARPAAMPADVPLFVDLDGTLVMTDLLYECFLDRFKRDWSLPTRAMSWLGGGPAHLKTRLAQGHVVPVALLPYDEDVLDDIRAARAAGRSVYLATASHRLLAQQVADHLGVFDGVIATEPGRNVSGASKLARLRHQTGSDRFEYLGNAAADIPIWDAAMHAGVAAPDAAARRWLARHPDKAHALGEHLSATAARAARLRVLRPHRWLENLLVALPLVAAHAVVNLASVLQLALAFVAFSLCASAVHVIDDLLDLDADRAHPRKRMRAFASGAVPLPFGFQAAPGLLLAAFAAGACVSWQFEAVLACYLAIAFAYSLRLKHQRVIGVLTLAALYTLRIAAGAVAILAVPSYWLSGFSIVLSLALALVRRSSEPKAAADARRGAAPGRNDVVEDPPLPADVPGSTAELPS